MNLSAWSAVDNYLDDVLVGEDPILAAALKANAAAGMPAHDVTPNQGKLLMLLARLVRARRVLEIGTLGGYSTIWLARGLPPNGHVVTLEVNPDHIQVARNNIARAALSQRIDLRVGPALDTLPTLLAGASVPFDMTFIDADKANNPRYLDWAIRLSRPGALIVGDNVVCGGRVVDPGSDDERVIGARNFLDLLGADPRVDATALQTVGRKGWDGFALALVNAD